MGKRKYPLTKAGRKPLHGAYSWLRSGFIPKEKAYLERWADSVTCEFIEDLGGQENVSTAQLLLLKQIKTLLVFQAIVEEFAITSGLIDSKGQVVSCLNAFYGMTVNQVRQNIALLGLKRQSKEQSLQDYIKANYPEPDTPVKSATNAQDARSGDFGSGLDQRDGSK